MFLNTAAQTVSKGVIVSGGWQQTSPLYICLLTVIPEFQEPLLFF